MSVVVGALLLTAGALTGVAGATPPRLASTAIDGTAAIASPGQRLTLVVDQPIAPVTADQVTVEPAASVEVSSSGRSISIRFTEMLAYSTTYRVAVTGVRGTTTGANGALEASFRTPSGTVLTSSATADAGQELLRTDLDDPSAPQRLYEAASIDEFVPWGAGGAVVISDEGDGDHVRIVADNGTSTIVPGPAAAFAFGLHAAPDGSSFGYLRSGGAPDESGQAPDGELLVVPANTLTPAPVVGFDGRPLSVMAWSYVPGADRILVEEFDGLTYLVDPLGAQAPAPYGRLGDLDGVLRGQPVAISDAGGAILLTDLTTGETTKLAASAFTGAADETLAALVPLTTDSALQLWEVYDASQYPPSISSRLSRSGPSGEVDLYRSPDGSLIDVACVAPNGHDVALQSIGDATTVIVDLDGGGTVATVEGTNADWCR